MNTLLERIDHLRELRGEPGKPLSYRELSRRAGLQETTVGTMATRLRRNPDASVESQTLLKIARGVNVSAAWLFSGEGPVEVAEVLDPYPARALAVRLAREAGIEEASVRYGAALGPPDGVGGNLTVWWLTQIILHESEVIVTTSASNIAKLKVANQRLDELDRRMAQTRYERTKALDEADADTRPAAREQMITEFERLLHDSEAMMVELRHDADRSDQSAADLRARFARLDALRESVVAAVASMEKSGGGVDDHNRHE